MSFIECLLLFFFRYKIAFIYTDGGEPLTSYAGDTVQYLSFNQFFDNLVIILIGLFRGLGLQGDWEVMYVVSFSYFGVIIPFGYVASIVVEGGVGGIWEGMTSGLILLIIYYSYKIMFRDW